MANKQDYLARLQTAVQHLHNCAAVHRETMSVHEVVRGETVWKGEVEVYDLTGHPKAKRAYAWSHRQGENDEGERFVAVLEIPPVDSAKKAVQVQIAKNVREKQAAPQHEHKWEFFDNCPTLEVYKCSICKKRKYVDLRTEKETYD